MENLNAEQIIKALEHCINRKDCSDCVIKSKERGSGCLGRPRAFFKNALSLIKELTEENNFLKEELRNATAEVFMLRERNADLHASCTELERKCASLNDERASLNEEYRKLKSVTKAYESFVDGLIPNEELIADTVRKMRERVTTFFTNDDMLKYNEVDADYINEQVDKIAKEMLEGENVPG